MCSAIPIVARDKSFADDLHMDQGRVSSRAALLLRSTERHPSDPRFVPNTHTRGLHARACLPPPPSHTHTIYFSLLPQPSHTHTTNVYPHTHTSKHTPRDESPVGDDEHKMNASNHRCGEACAPARAAGASRRIMRRGASDRARARRGGADVDKSTHHAKRGRRPRPAPRGARAQPSSRVALSCGGRAPRPSSAATPQ